MEVNISSGCQREATVNFKGPTFSHAKYGTEVRLHCRIVHGVEILARILHPDLWPHRVPENSVLKLSLKGGQRCRQRLIHNYFAMYSWENDAPLRMKIALLLASSLSSCQNGHSIRAGRCDSLSGTFSDREVRECIWWEFAYDNYISCVRVNCFAMSRLPMYVRYCVWCNCAQKSWITMRREGRLPLSQPLTTVIVVLRGR